MYLYDTAAQRSVEFTPRNGSVGIYVCGITPYDGGHLGHAFTYHTFDVLARRLRYDGIAVRTVRNITDVDDDILRVARERHVDYRELGDANVAEFDRDMAAIGLVPVDAQPRATANVPAMVSWIARLEEAEVAYAVDGWVYFSAKAFPHYGDLSHLGRAAMLELSAQRGGNLEDPRKRDPLDFVLWQPSLADEPHWPSFWGEGRPGWHIECSVLSAKELTLPIDIHGGGDDLIFPHHESEIAQAEAGGIREFARHWMHVAMVDYQGAKMSKSLGNLVFVRELLEQVPAPVIRLLLGAQHYRSSWEFDSDHLNQAAARHATVIDAIDAAGNLEPEEADDYRRAFLERLDDDLDIPGALGVIDIAAASTIHTGRVAPTTGGVSGAALLRELLDLVGVHPSET